MQMTVAELEVLSHHKPVDGKKKQSLGLLDPEQAALQKWLEYTAMSPREKLNKRIEERG